MEPERKQYLLDGLCCGNCAAKIEREVTKLDGVSAVNVDFASKTLSMELTGSVPARTIAGQAAHIAKTHDSDIVLKEKETAERGRKVMYLTGLDCSACAQKIEEAVARMDGVRSAKVDFVSQKLTIEAEETESLPAVARRAGELIRRIEPDVRISYSAKLQEEPASDVRRRRVRRAALIAGAALFAFCMLVPLPAPVGVGLFLVSYVLVGGEVIWRAVRNILRGEVFDEHFLMSLATAGAFAIGDFAEGVAVMLFYRIGDFFQDLAVDRSRRSISALMDIRPDYANLRTGDEVRAVAPEEVAVGECILVRPGEKIPLDGRVTEGNSSVDTSALTGESLPHDVEPGTEVLSGSVNRNGLLAIEVTKEFGESTVSRILNLVQNAGSRKSTTEHFITRFARWYTPAVVFSALALAVIPPLAVPGAAFSEWLNRALTFLVVSCPCALVISIPLSFFGGIGGASRKGILIKGSNYLEALNNVDTAVFDKTGTLTKGNFSVSRIFPEQGWAEETLLSLAAHAELYSSHPIAVSIRQAYGKEPDAARLSDYEEVPGKGIRVKVDGTAVLAGKEDLMKAGGVAFAPCPDAGTVVYFAADGRFAGSVVISDEIKPDSMQVVRKLKAAGVRRTVMLTGDSGTVGESVAAQLHFDRVYANLLPQQKVEKMEQLAEEIPSNGKIVFVGDGINDAPVLARADVGVAMGGVGSDAAIEVADVVLMTDEPSQLAAAIRIAKRTRSIVWQNIVFSLGVKVLILILAVFGKATMWEAVFGDVGVALIAVLNAMRAARLKP